MTTTLPNSPADTGLDPKRWLALAVVAVSQLMVVLDGSIVNIALPSAQKELDISAANIQWVVTAYTLTFGGLLLLGGRIADFMGRKRTFVVGLIGFAFASALGGIAPNQELLFAARALQGAFAALLAPSALSIITVTFTESHERAKAFGVFGAISGGGAAIGLILGGVLTEYASWRWCLGVNVPIAIITAFFAVRLVKESRADGDRTYDIPGAILATVGLASLVYGFTQAAKEGVGWTAPSTLAFLIGAVVLLVAFISLERRRTNPLLPLRILLDRNRGGSYLVFLLVGAGMFAMFLFLTFYFQQTLNFTPLKSGFAFLPFSGGIIITAIFASKLLPKFGPKPLLLTGLPLAVLGMLWLTQLGIESSYVFHVLPSELLMSVGMALVFIPASSTALIGVGGHDAGIASAVLNTSQQIGGSLGLALLNTFYASAIVRYMSTREDTPQTQADSFLHGYHVAFFAGSIILFLAWLVVIFVINAKRDDIPTDAAVAAH